MRNVTQEQLERLLYEEESPTLDFKRDQYPFSKASEAQKAELLKDILGFANAWRRSEAYILIGVEDVRGGRAIVYGIPEDQQLHDHSLQQFVNNLTNRPINFHYEAATLDGKHVGIIRIEQQTRPFYLKRDYGRLEKEKVYVRRGSSTDPSQPASLDEIAGMRVGSVEQPARLDVQFADRDSDEALGTNLSWSAELWKTPPTSLIPDLDDMYFGPYGNLSDPMSRTNTDYYRELASYEFTRRIYRPVRLVIENVGTVAARDVRVEINISKATELAAMTESQLPDPPQRTYSMGDYIHRYPIHGRHIQVQPGHVRVDENRERFRVEIECGDLQPSRRIWSEVFYLAGLKSGSREVPGLVYASNLPTPQRFGLQATVTVRRTKVSVKDLEAMPEPSS